MGKGGRGNAGQGNLVGQKVVDGGRGGKNHSEVGFGEGNSGVSGKNASSTQRAKADHCNTPLGQEMK